MVLIMKIKSLFFVSLLLFLATSSVSCRLYTGNYWNDKVVEDDIFSEKNMVQVTFETVPQNAHVFINDSLSGVTPFTAKFSKAWYRKLKIEKEGYISIEKTINITETQLYRFELLKVESNS